DKVFDISVKIKSYFSRIKGEIIVFDGFPKSFYPNIVGSSAFTIHSNFDLLTFYDFGPQVFCVLGTLIRVNNFRLAILLTGKNLSIK
ncbi:MAG: hypothetical protein EBU82_12830, partial [Flavobacteriia bacterium]|nr:hypothetical protein [Flavobacteriia bacterium]